MVLRNRVHKSIGAALAFAVIWLSGLPVLIIQICGWGLMLDRYMEIMSLQDAVQFTFEHSTSCGYDSFVEESTEQAMVQPDWMLWKDFQTLIPSWPVVAVLPCAPVCKGELNCVEKPLSWRYQPDTPPPKDIA